MSLLDQACALLSDLLKEGPRTAAEILAAAEDASISARTMQRAAEQMGVIKAKAGFSGGWTWALPEGGDLDSKVSTRVSEGQGANNGKVLVRVERAHVIAAKLRKLEAARGVTFRRYGATGFRRNGATCKCRFRGSNGH